MADRNPSKKRRQSQNEAAREARANRSASARTAAASPAAADDGTKAAKPGSIFSRGRSASTGGARPARTAAGVAKATGTSSSPSRPSRAAATKATPPGRKGSSAAKTPAKASASDDTPAPAATARPSRPLPPWLDRFGGNEPGGKWIVFSFIASVVASLTMVFAKVVTDVDTKTGKVLQIRDPHTHKLHNAPPVTAFQHGLARGFATVLPIPLVIGFTLLLSKPPAHRRTWYFGLVAIFLLVFLAGGSQLYLPAVACFGVGCWQARKAALLEAGGDPKVMKEQERALRASGRNRKGAAAADGDDA